MSRRRGQGEDDDHWGAFLAALHSFSRFMKIVGWGGVQVRKAMIRQAAADAQRAVEEDRVSGKLEGAGLGGEAQLEALGMFDGPGMLLGFFNGRKVRHSSDYHVAITAPAGFFKTGTLSAIAPFYLMWGDKDGQGRESVVIFDFKKAELYRTIFDGIGPATGTPPILFAPYDPTCKNKINSLQDVIDGAANGDPIVDVARSRLNSAFAEKIRAAGQNVWIVKLAQDVAVAVAVIKAHLDPGDLNMTSLHRFSNASYEDVCGFFEVASEYTELEGGFVADAANGFLNHFRDDDLREFRWVMQSMADAFTPYARGTRLSEATSATTIDIASLKRHPQALFVVIPDRYLDSAAPAISAILDYIVETVAHAPGKHRVTILAEEFGAMEYNPRVLLWLRTYRALGVRMVTVAQDLSAYSKYSKEGAHKPFFENSIRLSFGISDPDHLRALEQRCGKKAVLVGTASTSLGLKVPGWNLGASETLRPVLSAHEIATEIGATKALLEVPGQPVFILDRVPWWEQPAIAPYMRDARFDQD